MSLSINNNSGLYSGTELRKSQNNIMTSLAKLAAGRRITKAADDAAGLTVADSLSSQARGFGQAMRNAGDAASIVQIADGALAQSAGLVSSIRVKALQAANASQSPASRQALQADIAKSLTQLGEISATTSFNGQKLLAGGFTNKNFQIGNNQGETVNISISSTTPEQLGSQTTGRLANIDVTTAEGAQKAVSVADKALQQIDASRAKLGSQQNQLNSSIASLATSQINTLSSVSTIRDLDFAKESMNLSQMKTLNKIKIFAAVQANSSQKNVIDILQNQT
ncbi:MAG: flagellin [Deltaproteobacteria bacterium]|nr:flagellin [Deltaproteobacteria bacterium]